MKASSIKNIIPLILSQAPQLNLTGEVNNLLPNSNFQV